MSASLQFQSVGPIPLSDGSLNLNIQVTVASPVGAVTSTLLAVGNNTVTVPAGAPTYAIIQPPTTNTNTLTIKGVNGDSGVLMSKTAPTLFTIDTTVTTFVINASLATTVLITWI